MTKGTLQRFLQQQADKLPTEQPCPACGKLCPTKPHTRPLTAQGVEVEQVERIAHCPDCRRDFFPLRTALGLDEHGYSSSVLDRIVTAARFSSFRDATFAVQMSRIDISESQVRRLAHEVGAELIADRDRKAVEHRHRQLRPWTGVIPEAVVEVDGGRLRTRAAGSAAGVHDARNKKDKIACLVTLTVPTFATDPQPEPPESFLCPRRVQRLVSRMKGQAGEVDRRGIPEEQADHPVERVGAAPAERWSPTRLVRTCVASLESSSSFGPLVAAEAQGRHFYEAERRAFVADGAAYNWSIHEGYFREFEPVWPGKWSADRLRARKEEIGSASFARGYRLVPVADEDTPIRADWVQFWTNPAECKEIVLAVDPAVSASSNADCSALVVLWKLNRSAVRQASRVQLSRDPVYADPRAANRSPSREANPPSQ